MAARTITLCYRKIIEAHHTKTWEKMLFEDSYREFKMQFQLYNSQQQYHLLSEILEKVNGAEQIHFLVSAAVIGYIRQLNRWVPDVRNNLDEPFLLFDHYRFTILQSDVRDKAVHKIALCFFSTPLLWHDTIGEQVLVSEKSTVGARHQTHLLRLQQYIGINILDIN